MAKEIILDIREGSFKENMVGFKITTNKQEILVLIDDGQSCCESWGFLSTNDDTSEFIGAKLLSIRTTDKALQSVDIDSRGEMTKFGVSIDSAIFVNFETSKGTLQLVVYNEHNGYYGHDIEIVSNQINLQTTL